MSAIRKSGGKGLRERLGRGLMNCCIEKDLEMADLDNHRWQNLLLFWGDELNDAARNGK